MANYTEGTVIDFYDTVWYVCEEGHFFDASYDMVGFEITCKDDGSWDVPAWQWCVHPDGEAGSGFFLLSGGEKYGVVFNFEKK